MATLIDLKLGDDHEIVVENGDLVLIYDADVVKQSVKIRLLTILAEWVFDPTQGIDWIDDMLGMGLIYEQKIAVLKQIILETVGVRQINSFAFGVDPINKGALVEYAAETVFGNITGTIIA